MGKKKGRKMPFWRKAARAGVGIAGKILGGFVIAAPALSAWNTAGTSASGLNFAYQTVDNYVGYQPATGNFDMGRAVRGIATVVAGLAILKIFALAAKRF